MAETVSSFRTGQVQTIFVGHIMDEDFIFLVCTNKKYMFFWDIFVGHIMDEDFIFLVSTNKKYMFFFWEKKNIYMFFLRESQSMSGW